jgi:thiamine-phosphate pyrophosphorylase
LCYVTDRKSLAHSPSSDVLPALVDKIERVAAAGADWVQIREKDLGARELASVTRAALGRARAARFLVNDRVDVALAEKAGGVHLGETSLPVDEVKRLVMARGLRADFLIGVSCHSLEGAKEAERSGASYVFFGPVFATPSKAQFGTQGVERLAEVCRAVSIPVLAIGGITLENAGSCLSAGVAGIAAIRLLQDAADPAAVVRTLHHYAIER